MIERALLAAASLLTAAVLHEFAHAMVGWLLGDRTPHRDGRLTLDPRRHLDVWGSLVAPVATLVVSGGSFVIAWARPVEIDISAFRRPRLALAAVSAAGPAVNLLTGAVLALAIRVPGSPAPVRELLVSLSFWSLVLGLYNLIPVPPLDGWRVASIVLPDAAFELGERWSLATVAVFMGSNVALRLTTGSDPVGTGLMEAVVQVITVFAC